MRERWKQAGLILLSALAVWFAFIAGFLLLCRYPQYLMVNPSNLEAQLDLAIVCLAIYLAAARWIERRVPSELSLRHALPGLAQGALAGIALFSLAMAILWLTGAYQPDGWEASGALGRGFLFVLAVAVREEILYRGLLFRLLSKIVGTWGALLLSAAWFGASHATAPGATFIGLSGVALAGVLLGAAYAVTGRLWLPIGLHLGWNFAEGPLFGTLVSGVDIGPSLIQGELSGPTILTGGDFGPEASIVTVLVVLAAATYLLWRIARLKVAEPPIWAGLREATAAASGGQ
jgi:membrane protease YdiL (CAAX protease family)